MVSQKLHDQYAAHSSVHWTNTIMLPTRLSTTKHYYAADSGVHCTNTFMQVSTRQTPSCFLHRCPLQNIILQHTAVSAEQTPLRRCPLDKHHYVAHTGVPYKTLLCSSHIYTADLKSNITLRLNVGLSERRVLTFALPMLTLTSFHTSDPDTRLHGHVAD